jgi:hypothetical protein
MNDMDLDEELDKIQDELTEQSIEDEKEQQMVIDNRNSVLTIRDQILKKSQKDDDK